MFHLHETTRRRACRISFLLVCLLPTAVLLGWGAARRLPSHVRRHEDRLRHMLHLEVRLAGVEHPRPGVVRYHALELLDPERHTPIARCSVVETRAAALGARPRELRIDKLTIDGARSDGLANLCERLLQRHGFSDDLYLNVACDQVELTAPSAGAAFESAAGTIHSTDIGAEIKLVMRPGREVDSGPPPPASEQAVVNLRLVRNRTQAIPKTEFELHTRSWLLPCELFQMLAVGCQLPAQGRFSGDLWGSQEPAGWRIVAKDSRWCDLSLDALLAPASTHHLEGPAEVAIHWLRLEAGRIAEADVSLSAGPGRVSRSLLAAACQDLGCGPSYDALPAAELFDYGRFATAFRVTPDGQIVLVGQCAGGRGTMLATQSGQPLLGEPRTQPRPAVAIARTLANPASIMVPASPQSDWLLERLPLAPEGASPDTSTATRPHSTR